MNFQKTKCYVQAISLSPHPYCEFIDYREKSIDLDEAAHYGPPHQDLHCLRIQPFSSLVLKVLMCILVMANHCAGFSLQYTEYIRQITAFSLGPIPRVTVQPPAKIIFSYLIMDVQ